MPCRPGSLFLKHGEQLLPLQWRPSQPQNVFPTKLATRKANSFPHFYVVSFWTRRNQILISISVLVMKVSYHSGGKLEQKLAKGSPDWDRQLSTIVCYLYHSHLGFVGWTWWANWTWLLTSLSTIPCPFPEFPSHLHAPTSCIRVYHVQQVTQKSNSGREAIILVTMKQSEMMQLCTVLWCHLMLVPPPFTHKHVMSWPFLMMLFWWIRMSLS